jgi:hypothetical protein
MSKKGFYFKPLSEVKSFDWVTKVEQLPCELYCGCDNMYVLCCAIYQLSLQTQPESVFLHICQ